MTKMSGLAHFLIRVLVLFFSTDLLLNCIASYSFFSSGEGGKWEWEFDSRGMWGAVTVLGGSGGEYKLGGVGKCECECDFEVVGEWWGGRSMYACLPACLYGCMYVCMYV